MLRPPRPYLFRLPAPILPLRGAALAGPASRTYYDKKIPQGKYPTTRGFHVQPRRWVVERTLGWLMHHRRLARDYETHPHRSAAMIQLAAINLMTRRLTHETTPNWRNT